MDWELMLIEIHNVESNFARKMCYSIALNRFYKFIDKNECNS